MRTKLLMLFSLVLVIALAGCATKEPTKIQYKNDVITVENYVVDTLSPYSQQPVKIEFDVQNNGDQPAYDVQVTFFDVPGFVVGDKSLDCGIIDKENDQRWQFLTSWSNRCVFKKLEPLDSRRITLQLTAPDVQYPSSYTVSFSISYLYYGVRSATIPIVDGVIKKEPSFKFSQSNPTIGPVVFDIVPMLEREKIVDKKTVKEYWGISDRIFLTKFIMKHVGKADTNSKIKPVNAYVFLGGWTRVESIRVPCDFTFTKDQFIDTILKLKPTDTFTYDKTIDMNLQKYIVSLKIQSEEFKNTLEVLSRSGRILPYLNPANETYNTIICNFIPSGTDYEFTAAMKIVYFYNYEFIRSETFVVQPRVGFK